MKLSMSRTESPNGAHSCETDTYEQYLYVWFNSLRPSQQYFSYIGSGFLG